MSNSFKFRHFFTYEDVYFELIKTVENLTIVVIPDPNATCQAIADREF